VRRLAVALLDGAAPDAPAETRRELGWAAALHETGMSISHHDHHRHSAYIVAHADAAGFSQSQLRRVADRVLAQRGGLRKVEPRLAEPGFALQALCLRTAVIACHARHDVPADAIAIDTSEGAARPKLALSPAWRDASPMTRHLLDAEVEAWQKVASLRPAVVG
jgi:exopolyphosphatase/guanosine-5'-triphosphate,3'-diphosphate pyrophosphatase